MEVFLYKCELCTAARFSVVDKGEVWCIDCSGCRSFQFHHKVSIIIDVIMGHVSSVYFYCRMDKEVEDEHSDTRTNQKK